MQRELCLCRGLLSFGMGMGMGMGVGAEAALWLDGLVCFGSMRQGSQVLSASMEKLFGNSVLGVLMLLPGQVHVEARTTP